MAKLALLLLAPAAALVPSKTASPSSTALAGATLKDPKSSAFAYGLPGNKIPGNELSSFDFDPLGFAERASPADMVKYREAELKHGRVAMLASAGWIANGLHLAWPGTIDYTTPFSDLAALPPFEAWEKVPLGGKLQILAWAFCVELYSEMQKPHYLKGGDFVTYDWAKQAEGKSPAELLRKQNAELKNGRLAMLAFSGQVTQAVLTGHDAPFLW